MPGPYQNRRNYKMRANYPPAPSRSPYLSYPDLQKKLQEFEELHPAPPSTAAETSPNDKHPSDRHTYWPATPETKSQPTPNPMLEPAPAPFNVPAPAPSPMPEPTPAPFNVPEPVPSPMPEPAPAPFNVSEPAPSPMPEPAPAPFNVSEPAPSPMPEPTRTPFNVPVPAPSPMPEPTPAPFNVPEPVPSPMPEPTPAPFNVPEPVPSPMPEPTPAPFNVPEPAPNPMPEPTPTPVPVQRPEAIIPQLEPGPVVINPSRNEPHNIDLDLYCNKEAVDLPGYSDDMVRFFRSFPEEVRVLLTEVQKEIDSLDYDGSFIYDETPDITSLREMAFIILERARPLIYPQDREEAPDQTMNPPLPEGMIPPISSSKWIYNVIVVLISLELFNRRRNHNN